MLRNSNFEFSASNRNGRQKKDLNSSFRSENLVFNQKLILIIRLRMKLAYTHQQDTKGPVRLFKMCPKPQKTDGAVCPFRKFHEKICVKRDQTLKTCLKLKLSKLLKQ